jgi:hypothetical protein
VYNCAKASERLPILSPNTTAVVPPIIRARGRVYSTMAFSPLNVIYRLERLNAILDRAKGIIKKDSPKILGTRVSCKTGRGLGGQRAR